MQNFVIQLQYALLIVGRQVNERLVEAKKERDAIARRKIKNFKPTIRETFWGTSITWEMRDKPLTEEQLDALED